MPVYIAQAASGAVKVGYSTMPRIRVLNLARKSEGRGLELLAYFHGGTHLQEQELERAVHSRLGKDPNHWRQPDRPSGHLGGEWFAPRADLLNCVADAVADVRAASASRVARFAREARLRLTTAELDSLCEALRDHSRTSEAA